MPDNLVDENLLNFPLNFYDRPRIMVSNILKADLPASVKSLFAPDSMSPKEREDLSNRFKDDPLISGLIDVVSNPLVIIGLVLSLRYPVLKAGQMFNFARVARGAASNLSAATKFLGTPDHIFGGFKKVTDAIWTGVARAQEISHVHDDAMQLVAANFRKLTGAAPEVADEILTAQLLHGAHTVEGPITKELVSVMQKYGIKATRQPLIDLAALKTAPGFTAKRVQAIEESADIMRKMYKQMADKLQMTPEGLPKRVAEVITGRWSMPGGTFHATGPGRVGVRAFAKPGKLIENWYAPRRMVGLRTVKAEKWRQDVLQGIEEGKAAGSLYARQGVTLPYMDDLDLLRKAAPGVVNEGFLTNMRQLQTRFSAQFQEGANAVFARSTPENLGTNLQKYLTSKIAMPEYIARPLSKRMAQIAQQSGAEAAEGMGWAQQAFARETAWVGEIPQYSIRAFEDASRYAHTIKPSYAWLTPLKAETRTRQVVRKIKVLDKTPRYKTTYGQVGGEGPRKLVKVRDYKKVYKEVEKTFTETIPEKNLTDVIKEGAEGMDNIRLNILTNDYLPVFQGRKTLKQAVRQMHFNDLKLKYWETLQQPSVQKLFSKVPQGENIRKGLMRQLSEAEGSLSPAGLNAKLTGWLYFGAMGLNPSPALKNLTQPLLTTVPMVGWRSSIAGFNELLPKLSRYSRLTKKYAAAGDRLAIADAKAMEEVWPGFRKYDLIGHPEYGDITEEALQPWVRGVKKYVEGAKTGGMAMFTATERFNRLLSWEAGLAHARMTNPEWFVGGVAGEAAEGFAAQLVRSTQFPGGTTGMPHGMLNVPGVLRQFTQFPLRMLDFLNMSTKMGPGGRDWGTVGRAMLYSSVAYEGAKNALGMDISEASLAGAVPTPTWEGAPFYPLPLVPPVLSMAGGAAQALHTGEYERLPSRLATGIPGGLAIRRAYRTLRPAQAQYGAYTATGKIPVYDDEGRFIRDETPVSLFMRTIGVKSVNETTEYQMADYLNKQKDVLRQYRVEYLKALANNDLNKAERIQAEFQRRYPGLGRIKIKKTDIQGIKRSRELSRMERIMRQMPREYQPLFGQMTNMAQAENFGQMFNNQGAGLFVR